jgi:hypothetical protein
MTDTRRPHTTATGRVMTSCCPSGGSDHVPSARRFVVLLSGLSGADPAASVGTAGVMMSTAVVATVARRRPGKSKAAVEAAVLAEAAVVAADRAAKAAAAVSTPKAPKSKAPKAPKAAAAVAVEYIRTPTPKAPKAPKAPAAPIVDGEGFVMVGTPKSKSKSKSKSKAGMAVVIRSLDDVGAIAPNVGLAMVAITEANASKARAGVMLGLALIAPANAEGKRLPAATARAVRAAVSKAAPSLGVSKQRLSTFRNVARAWRDVPGFSPDTIGKASVDSLYLARSEASEAMLARLRDGYSPDAKRQAKVADPSAEGMTLIRVSKSTAARLTAHAKAHGLSVDDVLSALLDEVDED